MKTIYLLRASVPYEGSSIVEAFVNRTTAEARMLKLENVVARFTAKFEAMEKVGDAGRWALKWPEHYSEDLDIIEINLNEK